MTPPIRPLRILCALVILGCASAAWANPPAAIPKTDPAHARAERSFNEFATGWMKKMERLETANRAKPKLESVGGTTVASYRGYEDGFNIELKPTGSKTAPWVGILRYHELQFSCASAAATRCNPSKKTRVTEIFRFQGGKWVY
ncbi:MAG: hypothetical protein ABFS41_10175 [Myxococcota bacterium]